MIELAISSAFSIGGFIANIVSGHFDRKAAHEAQTVKAMQVVCQVEKDCTALNEYIDENKPELSDN